MISAEKKHQLVITGGSKGLGRAIADAFREEYEVVSVARSSGDYVGDLREKSFRDRIIAETDPYIFINNAGIYPTNENIPEMIELNLVAATHFTIELSKKMKTGFIFNISSLAVFDYSLGGFDSIAYSTAKRMLSEFGQLSHFINSRVKICTLEPGFIMTDLANIRERYEKRPKNDILTRGNITPMDPSHVVRMIRWIISQPPEISISNIRIANTVGS